MSKIRQELHALTEQQAAVLTPHLEELARRQRAVAEQQRAVLDLLKMAEPEMASPDFGYDLQTKRFYRMVEPDADPPPLENGVRSRRFNGHGVAVVAER